MEWRKWIIIAFLVIITAFFVIRDSTNGGEAADCQYSTSFYYNQQDAVELSIAPGTTISKDIITVRFTNNASVQRWACFSYILESRIGECWEMVPYTFPSPGNTTFHLLDIPPYSYVDLETNLQTFFRDLPDGEYRIIRNIFLDSYGSERSSFQVMVEFTI